LIRFANSGWRHHSGRHDDFAHQTARVPGEVYPAL
jgi:hypothetical protein